MRRVMLTLTLVATACGTQGTDPTGDHTSTLSDSSTTSTSAVASTATNPSTTTTEALPCVETLDDGRLTSLEPTCRYTHRAGEGTFVIDLDVSVTTNGWVETVNSPRVMRFEGFEFDGLEAQLDVIVMPSTQSVDSVTERVASENSRNTPLESTEPEPAVISGLPGVTLDVFHAYDPTDWDPCGESLEAALILVEAGAGTPDWFGPEYCTWTRAWIVEVNDTVVVLLGSDTRRGGARLDAAEAGQLIDTRPILENAWADLVEGLTFCTEATPCEG